MAVLIAATSVAAIGPVAQSPSGSFNVRPAILEVTQGVQRAGDATVPLVAGRPTVVRVFADVEGDDRVVWVDGQLCVGGGAGSSCVRSVNGPVRIRSRRGTPAPRRVPRQAVDEGLVFRLKSWWLRDQLEFEVVLGEVQGESNVADNRVEQRVRFEERRGIRVAYLQVEYANPAWTGKRHPGPHVREQRAADWARAVFPVDPAELVYGKARVDTIRFAAGDGHRLDEIRLLTQLKQMIDQWTDPPDQLVAWIPEGTCPCGGIAPKAKLSNHLIATADFGYGFPKHSKYRRSLAHELAHNHGREHPANDEHLASREVGYDVLGVALFGRGRVQYWTERKKRLWGLMAQQKVERSTWVRPPTYEALFHELAPRPAASPTAGSSAPPPIAPTYLAVSGAVLADGSGELYPFFETPPGWERGPLDRQGITGTHSIVFLDSDRVVRQRFSWTPEVQASRRRRSGDPFVFYLEPPSHTARVELRHFDKVLAARDVLPEPPIISDATAVIEEAEVPTLRLFWTSRLPGRVPDSGDSPRLTHRVSISADGERWDLIAPEVVGGEWAVPLSALRGCVECWLKVVVSDGFNTSELVTGPVEIPGHPPEVQILEPRSGETFLAGAGVPFRASGFDHEDGELQQANYLWTTSDGGTVLAGSSGGTLDLPPGEYKITLRVSDSDYNETTALPVAFSVVVR